MLWWKSSANPKLDFTFHMGICLCRIFIYIFCDSIKLSSYLYPLGYSSTHLIMTSMKSFSLIVTSFRASFIEMKIKEMIFFSLPPKEKWVKSQVSDDTFLISHISYCAVSLPLCALLYCDDCAWNQSTGFCGLVGLHCWLVSPPLSQHCF